MNTFKTLLGICAMCLILLSCDSSRSNTEADREATYTEDGKEVNPTEGKGEGTAGKKYMETTDADSTQIEQ